jgi:hypothetical protein
MRISSTGLVTLQDAAAEAGIQLGTGADFTIKRNVASFGAQFNVAQDLNNFQFSISGTEALRIDGSGAVLIGRTTFGNVGDSFGTAFGQNFAYFERSGAPALYIRRGTSTGAAVEFYQGTNTFVGSISVTASATAYNTSSDYRLKENVVSLTGAADRLNQLQVHRFNFIADPDTTVDGFIAHEAQEIVPECVTGEKDAVDADGNPIYQGIDQSKLVPLLTAALQEAIGRIETLEAEVTALKAQ